MIKGCDTAIEVVPDLDPSTLENPQRVQVRYDLELTDGHLNFIMVDTTPWPEGSKERAVTRDSNGNYALVVERGRDRIFEFQLNSIIDWAFDPDGAPGNSPMTIKRGSAALYKAELASPTLLLISAKARPNPPREGAQDHFNLYVRMGQATGEPIALRIDPVSENPPDGG